MLLSLCNLTFFFLLAPCRGEGLKCYTCVSKESWDDCEKKKKAQICDPHHNDVCIKHHFAEHSDDTEQGYKEMFVKMCGKADLCTNKDCKRKGKYCKVDCCHNDLCNSATSPAARMTITLLSSFVVIFAYFLHLRFDVR